MTTWTATPPLPCPTPSAWPGTPGRGAGLYDGDGLVVDRSLEPTHPDIGIAVLHGERTGKRLFRPGTLVQLRPANHRDPIITVTPDQAWLIWGVVSGSRRQFQRSGARWPYRSSPGLPVTMAPCAASGSSARASKPCTLRCCRTMMAASSPAAPGPTPSTSPWAFPTTATALDLKRADATVTRPDPTDATPDRSGVDDQTCGVIRRDLSPVTHVQADLFDLCDLSKTGGVAV